MGRVGAPHGVHGAFRVRPVSADPASLLAHTEWLLRGRTGTWTAHRVRGVREQGDGLVAQLDGIESRDAAGALRGAEIGVPRESLPAPAKDEYYQADLIGMAVVNREGVPLGALADFVDSGAHPIARVRADGGVERLIPWVPLYIDGVDMDGRRIDVDWPADA
ncbi:MAG TPA: ribosome maturation factor RimM [Casimicrobiaceae bacterium]|jgi:16S rRNA processing protein RimM|nr:ribosome maturation factor RimM [Casimicrobiaceae bacterium]